jgi:hypothetical protein
MGAFMKKRSSKIRTIHDLSWPPGESVNSFISADNSSVKYISIEDAVKQVKLRGKNSLLCKVDLQDAYKSIVVRPADWHYLGSSWLNDENVLEFYIDHVLPFGLRSSARLFDMFATALEYCMKVRGVTNACHYLDDFMSCGSAGSNECADNLKLMLETCDELGMKVNPKKVLYPATQMEYLGIIIDSESMCLKMSDERLSDVIDELNLWEQRSYGTKRELLSLLGKLVFLSRVIRPGRIFCRRLFTLSSKVKHLHHRVRISKESGLDIRWWLKFATAWNQTSMFYDDMWTTSASLELATDASNIGYGGVFKSKWFKGLFSEVQKVRSIAWRELYAIVVACKIWSSLLTSRLVRFNFD